MPRRRWVGRTVTSVTAATGISPPGTVMSNGTQPAVPTIVSRPGSRSTAASSRLGSRIFSHCSRPASLISLPNAVSIACSKSGQSSRVQARRMISEVMTLLVRRFVRLVAGVPGSMASSGWYNRAMPSDSNADPADASTVNAVPGPLGDLKVVDLSRVLAGPYLTMMLGDMGAEVVKIEQPGSGDDTRRWGPPFVQGESTYYLAVNRNKRSVTLNLKHPRCREILLQMIQDADILVENFKTGTMERMGLGYEDVLRPLNPRLVYVSVTGYGRTGPYAERPGYDYMGQAMGGIMSVTGEPNGEPMKYGVAIADLTTAMSGCSAVLAAIHHRDRTGKGQRVDLSLLETVVGWLIHLATDYFATG